MEKKKIYIIGAGGIGVSAIARYYNDNGYEVFGSDSTDSQLIQTLKSEGINIIIGSDKSRINNSFEKIVYTEAVKHTQEELAEGIKLGIFIQTYPQALAEIANKKRLIAVTGTHGKSTTTSLISIMMQNTHVKINAVIGTILKEFNGKNTHFSDSDFFAIEACEYKRSFLQYSPEFLIITNIEADHLDYYKDEDDYISAFNEIIDNVKTGGYVIYNGQDKNCLKLKIRKDLNYIAVGENKYTKDGQDFHISNINMKVPGDHILFDAHLAYTLGDILDIPKNVIISALEKYSGVWRRMEILGTTQNKNLVYSDYGHHPTEIQLTLEAIKNKYPDKRIITIFQPHQYSRTIELLEDFKISFNNTHSLVIPNIYESRDSKEDIESMNTQKLLDNIEHSDKINGVNLDYTQKIISHLDEKYSQQAVIILLGAGDVDNLRYTINFQK